MKTTCVSMPCLGLSPFLQLYELITMEMIRVSMPCLGLSPFLQDGLCPYIFYLMLCVNALSRAIPISTYAKLVQMSNDSSCVNALSRAIPISTKSPSG